ncbi:PAS domain S-box protein [Candidatus Accumulibacter vicinus]|uniref:Oxygen sensor histidine kinase NreB n=1 Tax=Candidatus Accumulibacter vicinus TaxID=2954382 RepID=A0A084XV26_9PROT|nr:PAS domain S-box protein [Candidatus Accumulibacter vicinus]KFB66320.1 MAG: Signal transduction histidine-protein kinase/phosphatase DegS [Candidatus Accumulibacter vicinus]
MNDAHRRRGPPATFDDACRLIRELQSQNEALSAELAAREQAASDLQFSEAQYRAVIETSPDGFWVVDREGYLLEANETYARLSGYSRAELRGMHVAELEAEENRAAVMAHMERVVEQGSDLFQTRHRAKSGRLWHAEINVSYWPLAGRRFFAFVRDVHRRQRAEVLVRARLHLSDLARNGTLEELLRTALDIAEAFTASEIGFFHFVDADQEQLTRQAWSSQTLQMCAAPALQEHCAIGEAGVWVEAFHRRAPVIHNDYAHLPGRKGLPPGHSALTRQLTVPLLRGEAVVAIVGVGNKREDYTDDDVTMLRELASMTMDLVERKQVERRIVESRNELQRVYDSVPVMICQLDPDHKVVEANAFFRSRTGWPDNPINLSNRACDLLGCVHALDDARGCGFGPACRNCTLRRSIQDTIDTAQPHVGIEYQTRLRIDDVESDFTALCSTARIRKNGETRILLSLIDITDRKRAELHLAQSNERLRQLSQRLLSVQEEERRALARELHDDFGQQLGALKVNLAMLERDVEHAGHRRRLADCIEIAQYAREHIQDTARRLRPPILDDLGLAETLRWYARSQAERAGCVVEVNDRLANLSPELETAAFRIVQEAVSNAIRHGKARRIVIDAAVDGRDLSLVIADDGCGFDPQAISYGFQSGLGLIGMRERSALLGGRFALASQPGRGVRIAVTLPLLPAAS